MFGVYSKNNIFTRARKNQRNDLNIGTANPAGFIGHADIPSMSSIPSAKNRFSATNKFIFPQNTMSTPTASATQTVRYMHQSVLFSRRRCNTPGLASERKNPTYGNN